MSLALALALGLTSLPGVDDARLSTADLPAYRKALESKDRGAEPVGFHDLWEHPEQYRERRVQVRGTIVRRFAQPAFGAFPPLTESWLRTPGDNPICLVYPTPRDAGRDPIREGDSVIFEGTFLRRLRYPGGDGPRLAPLVVGGSPPRPDGPPRETTPGPRLPPWIYWAAAVPIVACLGLLMAWLHLQRPSPARPPRVAMDFFLEGEDDSNPPLMDRPGTGRPPYS